MADSRNPDGSTRIGKDDSFATSGTGSDVTGRMAGTGAGANAQSDTYDSSERDRVNRDTTARHDLLRSNETVLASAKTSATATFGLVFGLSALFCALTAILAPAAVVFGLIGLILSIVGIKKGKLPHVTGHKLAIGGLVTSILGLLIGGAVLAGAAAIVNNEGALDRISTQVDNLREQVPSGSEITETVR